MSSTYDQRRLLVRKWGAEDKRRLVKLASEGLSALQIAKALDRTRGAVHAYASRNSIPICSKNSPLGRVWSEDEMGCLREIALQGGTIHDVVRRIPWRSYSSVDSKARVMGLTLTRPDWSNHVNISSELRQILDGVLVSDGSLLVTSSGRSAALSIEQHPKRLGWLQDIQTSLMRLGVEANVRPHTRRPKKLLEGRRLPGGIYHILRTLSYAEFVDERDRWYGFGVKRVPQDIRLTPLLVAHWMCGDGYAGGEGGLGFCTNGFSKECVELLIERFAVDLGISSRIYRTQRVGQYHVVVGKLNEAYRLASLIRPYMPECCLYKIVGTRPFWGKRKLSPDDVRRMRSLVGIVGSVAELGRIFGVSWSVADRIVKRVTYKDVE